MKTLTTLICLMLSGQTVIAQNIQFDYDVSGNRILRKLTNALPVTLISFTAKKSGSSVIDGSADATALLNWQTSSEINSDHFNIQRSQNGKNWLNIGTLAAKGNPSAMDSIYRTYNYSFEDNEPAEGENMYRLKMVDKDGSFAYSQIHDLYFEPYIVAYPNPVNDLLTLKWAALRSVQIFDTSGKLVYQTSHNVTRIDVSKLPAGVYLFKLTGKDGSKIVKRVVKE